jgi:hypothetical protein
MTTVTFEFEEDIKISNNKWVINISDFFDILRENEIIPELKELDESQITPEILKAYERSKKLPESSFINL